MIDLNVYRSRIGSYFPGRLSCRTRNVQGGRFVSQSVPTAFFCLWFSYLYFAVVVFSLIMSISICISKISKPDPTFVLVGQFSPIFNLELDTLTNLKYLFCIIIIFAYKSVNSNKKVHTCIMYKLYLRHQISKTHRIGRYNRLGQSLVLWMFLFNFLSITIINPSLLNPGPPRANQSVQTRPLKIFYNNVQGFINPNNLKSESPPLNMTKLSEFQGYIFQNMPDIIVVNESWLKKAILDDEILNNYKIIRTDRSGKTHPWDPAQPKKYRKNGGGIFIAHRRDIGVESTEVGLAKVKAEILTVNFKLPTGKKFSLSTFYRVGTLGMQNFDLVKEYLTTLATKKKLDRHILIGDLNFPEIVWPNISTTVELHKKFVDLLLSELNHTQLIHKPTHKNGNILDLLFTNVPELIKNLSVLGQNEACKSDHFGITFDIKLDVSVKKTQCRKEFDYSKADWRSLNFDLKRIDWNQWMGSSDPHMSWLFFKEVALKLCEKHIPQKSVRNQFQPPWFDSDCDKILREKEKWRAKAHSENGTEEDHEKFKSLRSKFKKVMNEKMRLNVVDESDPTLISKKYWKHVISKSKSSRIPETIWYKNKFRTKAKDQANLFNNFFFEQFSGVSNYDIDIDMLSDDPFMNLKFHELDVLLLLKGVNSSKAAGPDGIHGLVLKNCAAALCKPLTFLFNISFVTGCIPDEWKLASIVPVHKKADKGSVENYRPISLTSLIMKVFEKCIRKEMLAVCNHLLDPRQHGFVNEKSCITQMAPFTYELATGMNKKSKIDVIYFDFAKAFDSVSHDLILKKLKEKFGINGLMLRFVKSYLQGRQQQVIIGGTKSDILPVKSGVPQGSILGPLLFVIFINDMFQSTSQKTNIALYADDTKIWREIQWSEDHFALQKDIDALHQWSLENKMKFHPSKCKALSVTNQRNELHNLPTTIFNYKLGPNYIDYVQSQVDLGVTVNDKLRWSTHCEKIIKTANSKLALLKRTCHFTVNIKQKRAFYLTIVRSVIENCCVVWRPISHAQILKFEAIQKRAVKWMNGKDFDHYSDEEYSNQLKEIDILPLHVKFDLSDLIMYYKIIHRMIPINLPNDFTLIDPSKLRYTRNNAPIIDRRDVTQVKCSTSPNCDIFRNSFFHRTMLLWNKVPYEIRQEPSFGKFKTLATKYLSNLDWPD